MMMMMIKSPSSIRRLHFCVPLQFNLSNLPPMASWNWRLGSPPGKETLYCGQLRIRTEGEETETKTLISLLSNTPLAQSPLLSSIREEEPHSPDNGGFGFGGSLGVVSPGLKLLRPQTQRKGTINQWNSSTFPFLPHPLTSS